METRCIAEFETHDPTGRYLTLSVYTDHEGNAFYEPKLHNGDAVRLSYVFRTGEIPPGVIKKDEVVEKLDEIESKIRYFCSAVKKKF